VPAISTSRVSSLTMSQSPASSSCGRSDQTSSVTTSAAGLLAGPVTSTRSPSRPERAARQIAARPSVGLMTVGGEPARSAAASRSTNARNSPAISTMVSTDGQLSHTRSSSVGADVDGRTSKYTMPSSVMTPLAMRSRTSWSYSAVELT
jgi:hypothetical protein